MFPPIWLLLPIDSRVFLWRSLFLVDCSTFFVLRSSAITNASLPRAQLPESQMPWSKGAHCWPHWTYYPVILCWGVAQNTHPFVNGFCASLLIHIDVSGDRSPPSQYVHRRNRPDLSVPNCHSYSHKKAILATECDICSGYSLCSCHVSLSNACTRWHDSKRFIGTPVLGKGRTTPMNIISLAMSFTICHQWPRLSVDAILVLVLLQLVAGGARNTTQSAASFPRLNMNCMFSSNTGPD